MKLEKWADIIYGWPCSLPLRALRELISKMSSGKWQFFCYIFPAFLAFVYVTKNCTKYSQHWKSYVSSCILYFGMSQLPVCWNCISFPLAFLCVHCGYLEVRWAAASGNFFVISSRPFWPFFMAQWWIVKAWLIARPGHGISYWAESALQYSVAKHSPQWGRHYTFLAAG